MLGSRFGPRAEEESLDSKREGSLIRKTLKKFMAFQIRRLAKTGHGKCHRKQTASSGKGENVW